MADLANVAGLEAAPMLDLQGVCPENHCLRGSPDLPPEDRLSMRLSGHRKYFLTRLYGSAEQCANAVSDAHGECAPKADAQGADAGLRAAGLGRHPTQQAEKHERSADYR